MNVFQRAYRNSLRKVFFAAALAFVGGASTPAVAGAPEFAPQTKIRLKVVQWMPTKGEYAQWALGGEYVVSEAGEISLPVIGTFAVGNLDRGQLAVEIAKRLQAKIGLVEAPEAIVEVLEYPPVYVVGDVAAPGEYKFRPGLTVLQSLAMSGGYFRQVDKQTSAAIISQTGELRTIRDSLLRSDARISRLKAELSGTTEISFSGSLATDVALGAVAREQETVIFAARLKALERQSKSLSELRDLYNQEIDVLAVKMKDAEASIKSAEKELGGVKSLVEKGVAVSSRQWELERALAAYRADRLDLVTAIMRARQNISEATRNLEGLNDTRKSEVAAALQSEQEKVDQLKLKRETTERLLLEILEPKTSGGPTTEGPSLTYSITRRANGKATEFPASEATDLMPGDVVRVVRQAQQRAVEPAAHLESPGPTGPKVEPASQ
ncbi:polysaccharide biosynthesis/export family protein [Sinorhizobium meliloti]|uniref:polysaccharide biosynthesis/export family protein n=1 Tax=Rhizobium meliloti TaxID=382 RepID=UPI00037C66A0|nr:polysaccharide biosynthesis/export family protein [Sinorhizobium meliloti]